MPTDQPQDATTETDAGPWAHAGQAGDPSGSGPLPGVDIKALLALLDGLRQVAPAELQARLDPLIRELLMTIRALIDWYLERLDEQPPKPRVQDIPID